MNSFALYLHIPYCLSKCPYCDFNSYAAVNIPERDYLSALLAELDFRAQEDPWRGRAVSSIYFGGGTPSLFSPFSIQKIITGICKLLPVDDLAEITLEANPGSLSAEALQGFRDAGLTRLSIGAQSFNQETLSLLGRIHTPAQVDAAVSAARQVGCANLNLDLLYGVPRQNIQQLEADLQSITGHVPEHISAYGLSIEKGTPFYSRCKKAELLLPDEDLSIEMFKLVRRYLLSRGYEHYEISNFAKPGREARHNSAYWAGSDYLGLGAGAHSYAASAVPTAKHFGKRWSNYAYPTKYIKACVDRGQAAGWQEILTVQDAIFEFFFLGLRRIRGVSSRDFTERFGLTIDQVYPALLEILCTEGLLSRHGEQLALSEKAILVADSVIANFSAPEIDVSKVVLNPRKSSPTQRLSAANE